MTAGYLRAQLAYTRVLFDLGAPPGAVDIARRGFEAAANDEALAGWGRFWLGVLADNVTKDPAGAAKHYAAAAGHTPHDPLLESYVRRHQGFHLLDGDHAGAVKLLRRSYALRAALGARPQTAAAAAVLADILVEKDERRDLREAALLVARELKLAWLLDHFDEGRADDE